MSSETWDDILLQWVNCLKLLEPIKNFDDLQNGRFIARLLEILVASNDELHGDVFTHVHDLIHSHYPNYDLKTDKHLSHICSLLMHYSCMVQQNEILIKPLCRISSNVQLSIRTFLQKTDRYVTAQRLKNIITESLECNDLCAKSSSHENTANAGQSPLHDFLKTPNSRKIRIEKDRDIKRLRSELELERFEKADLLDDNLQYREKIKALGNELKEKCREILKLKSEVYTLENTTPPADVNIEIRDVERNLRSQVDNLELCIASGQSERDVLQADVDRLSEKLKKSQDDVIAWREKAATWETNCEDLAEKCFQETAEKVAITKEYAELKMLLDEMRNARNNDSFLERSPPANKRRSVAQSATEDLAHSIVEVQLKDAQNEIYELVEQLKVSKEQTGENEVRINDLTEDLRQQVEKYNNLNENYHEVVMKLERTETELQTFTDEKIDLKAKITDQRDKYERDAKLAGDRFASDLNSFKSALEESNDDLKLQGDIRRRLERDVEELNVKIIDVVLQNDDLLRNNANLELAKLKLETDLKQLQCSNKKYIENSNNELHKLKTTIVNQTAEFDSERDRMKDTIVVLENAVESKKADCSKIQKSHNETLAENEELREKLLDYENRVSEMTIEESSLRTQIGFERDSYLKLTTKCENSEENNKKTLAEYENTILKLKCDNDVLQSDIERIKVELRRLQERSNRVEEENNVANVQFQNVLKINNDEIFSLQQKLEANTKQLVQTEEEMLNTTFQLNNIKDINDALRDEIRLVKDESKRSEASHQADLSKVKLDNSLAISDMSKNFNELRTAHDEMCVENTNLKRQTREIRQEKAILEQEISKNNLTIDHLEKASAELEQKLELHKNEINTLEHCLDSQRKGIKETENNILRVHADAIAVKNDMLKQIEEADIAAAKEKNARVELEELLKKEIGAREFLEKKISTLNEQTKYKRLYDAFKKFLFNINESIESKSKIQLEDADENNLNAVTTEIEQHVVRIHNENRTLSGLVASLQLDKSTAENKLKSLDELQIENEKLLILFEEISDEKNILLADQVELRKNYESNSDAIKELEIIKAKNIDLQRAVVELSDNAETFNYYKAFVEESKNYRDLIDKVLKERNSLETIVIELRQRVCDVGVKYVHINEQSTHKQLFERKEAIEIVTLDVQREFSRYSKIIYNIISSYAQIYEVVVQAIFSNKKINYAPLLKDLCVRDVLVKVEELRDRTSDGVEQIKSFEKFVERFQNKSKVSQENVTKLTTGFKVDSKKHEQDDWKKKYIAIKQKLTLSENIKNNYEKKLKQLREENKTLSVHQKNLENGEEQRKLNEKEACEKRRVSTIENGERESKLDKELHALRAAYGNLMADNSKLELDKATFRKRFDDLNAQLYGLSLIKEAYEKLLEDNNKLTTEVDTLTYKRTRDKENFARALKKENEEKIGYESKRIQEVRSEYDGKLEKMKEKMIKLYKAEVEKEMEKMNAEKTENAVLLHAVQQYKVELDEAMETIKKLKMQNEPDEFKSGRVTNENPVRDDVAKHSAPSRERSHGADVMTQSRGQDLLVQKKRIDNLRYSTLPRNVGMDVIKEVRVRKTSVPSDIGQDLEMEDEGELFNNKYLTDLQEGRCTVPSGRESTVSRMSELAWRNSMCPPHLKSSYPAETQFVSPTQFHEDDVKTGIAFDDSISTRLLPGEKPRKKDFGTTSYKKPGPPTPSKNAGRLSSQSGELHSRGVLKEQNESKTPKRTTPNRLKALFMGRNASVRDSENQAGSPRANRLSNIFRKHR